MRLNRGDAHVELAADFGVGLAASDRDGDLAFAFGEAVELFACVAAALAAVALGGALIALIALPARAVDKN